MSVPQETPAQDVPVEPSPPIQTPIANNITADTTASNPESTRTHRTSEKVSLVTRLKQIGCGTLLLGGIAFGMVSGIGLTGQIWGSRGTVSEYSFTYQGKLGHVMREDLIWAPDGYFIQIDRSDGLHDRIYRGAIRSDEGETIDIGTYTPGSMKERTSLSGSWEKKR